MALSAGKVEVLPAQREAGPFVAETDVAPCVGGMAIRAPIGSRGDKLLPMNVFMARFASVGVLPAKLPGTLRSNGLSHVAGAARYGKVASGKEEAGPLMLFRRERGRSEAVDVMTRFTGTFVRSISKLARMRIGMAVTAAGEVENLQRAPCCSFFSAVALFTFHRRMAAKKRKSRGRVTELAGGNLLPSVRRVAALTRLLEPAFMGIAVT